MKRIKYISTTILLLFMAVTWCTAAVVKTICKNIPAKTANMLLLPGFLLYITTVQSMNARHIPVRAYLPSRELPIARQSSFISGVALVMVTCSLKKLQTEYRKPIAISP